MGGEALGVLYRPSQPYHPVDFEGGLLCDMQPHRRARSDPTQATSGPAQDPETALVS